MPLNHAPSVQRLRHHSMQVGSFSGETNLCTAKPTSYNHTVHKQVFRTWKVRIHWYDNVPAGQLTDSKRQAANVSYHQIIHLLNTVKLTTDSKTLTLIP